jgi:hypothetical protein
MGYLKEKNGSTAYSESPISPGEPLSAVSGTSYASLANFEKKDLVSQFLCSAIKTSLSLVSSLIRLTH